MVEWMAKQLKDLEENLPLRHFTTNHTWTALGLNPIIRSKELGKSSHESVSWSWKGKRKVGLTSSSKNLIFRDKHREQRDKISEDT